MLIRAMLALLVALGLLAPLGPSDDEQEPPPNCLPCRAR